MGKFVHAPKPAEEIISFAQRKNLLAMREAVFRGIQEDQVLCARLNEGLQHLDYAVCSQIIVKKFGKTGLFEGKHGTNAIREFLSWAGKRESKTFENPVLTNLLLTHRAACKKERISKRRLINHVKLNPKAFDNSGFYSTLPVISAQRLPELFPPRHLYISETNEIFKNNMKFVLERDLPDWRKWRKLIFELKDPSLLAHDLPPTESAIFKDAEGPVAIVIRNACGHKGVLKFLDETVEKVVATRNTARVRQCYLLCDQMVKLH